MTHITIERAKLKQVLEALKNTYALRDDVIEAITTLTQAFAAPTVQPVGEVKDLFTQAAWEKLDVRGSTKVYLAAPPAQPAVPEGWKLVPAVPTNEWVNNLAKMQTGDLEEVPFVEIHQCIAELLDAAPEKGQP